ncbi:MAG: phospholipase D-like domain-containing protein [Candidatus Moraniibacteriota bacterium]|jgi:cardiolipin synthase C
MYTKIKQVYILPAIILIFISFSPSIASADSVKLLEDPHEAWQARIDLIEQAQDTIEVEYYAIEPDTAGKIFIGSLYEAANRGVKVRILIGGLTHSTIPDEAIGVLIQHPNIELRFHNTLEKWYKPSHWLKALHDKVLLVDDKYLISGGRNIADKYFDMTPPEKQQTIDRDVLFVGAENSDNIPMQVKKYFNNLWMSRYVSLTPTENHITKPCKGTPRFLYNDFIICTYDKWKLSNKIPQTKEDLQIFLNQYKQEHPEQFDTKTNWAQQTQPVNSIRFAHDPTDVPKTYKNGTSLALATELRNAKKSILYFTPYIVKTRSFLETAEIAKQNGVKQTVLTNSAYSGANVFGMAGTELDYKDFHSSGLEYWTWQGFHSMHHKTYIIDNHITISSTFNYDPRSQNLNTEMLFIIDDADFTKIVQEANQVLFDNALQLDTQGNTIPRDDVTEESTTFIDNIIMFLAKIPFPIIRWAI